MNLSSRKMRSKRRRCYSKKSTKMNRNKSKRMNRKRMRRQRGGLSELEKELTRYQTGMYDIDKGNLDY